MSVRAVCAALVACALLATLALHGEAGVAAQEECRPGERGGVETQGAPSRPILDAFAVLRRPKRSADRVPRRLAAGGPLKTVSKRYTRFLGTRAGKRFWLIPGEAVWCAGERPKRYLCVVEAARDGRSAGWGCRPTASVRTLPGFGGGIAESGPEGTRFVVAGLAPDPVVRIEAAFDDGTTRVVRARRNLFVFTVLRPADALLGSHHPTTVRYLDAAGNEVMRYERT